ncbi:MAG: hypothetical protein KVP17_003159 [Porospora cf. gigantea B]|uniref:uncharacterized protein n=1 Tax=Porospora cf. gigantea B TaxID=2853592 RepID=UPI0035717ABC|nr:MAG: hypothetical protein KVP17_003159 [Porospora cf. gigantea B]
MTLETTVVVDNNVEAMEVTPERTYRVWARAQAQVKAANAPILAGGAGEGWWSAAGLVGFELRQTDEVARGPQEDWAEV